MGNEKGGGAVRCIQNFNFIHVPLDLILLFQLLILLISKSGMEQLFYNPFFFVCKLKKIFAVRKRWEGGGIPLPTLLRASTRQTGRDRVITFDRVP